MNAPRLLYVVSEDWYFLSHRLPMARAAKAAGFDVHVACNVTAGAAAIAREGFTLHPIRMARGKLSPASALATIMELRAVQKAMAPAIAHRIALQPVVLGALASLGRALPSINALTGLGFVFSSQTMKARLIRPFFKAALKWLLSRNDARVLVQNPDDSGAMVALGIPGEHIALIAGSGVDTTRLSPSPEPTGDMTVTFVGRLLADKGVHALIEAKKILNARGQKLRLILAGERDPANPTSVTANEIARWSQIEGVSFPGHVENVGELWKNSHIAILPSRREGLPLSLLEAAACGRPMIATDVPGCREITVAGETGLLVPPDNAEALADAIEKLALSADLRAQYGAAARKRVEERFSTQVIGEQIAALYRTLIGKSGS